MPQVISLTDPQSFFPSVIQEVEWIAMNLKIYWVKADKSKSTSGFQHLILLKHLIERFGGQKRCRWVMKSWIKPFSYLFIWSPLLDCRSLSRKTERPTGLALCFWRLPLCSPSPPPEPTHHHLSLGETCLSALMKSLMSGHTDPNTTVSRMTFILCSASCIFHEGVFMCH